jgi:CRP/FNR family transcriptional regulator
MLLLRRGTVLRTTHQQLADELGSVREVISRLLNDFKEQGAVVVERGKIQIINKTILEQIAQAERDLSH